MFKLDNKQSDFEKSLNMLYNRPGYPPEIEKGVAAIIDDVRTNGNAALFKYALQFDKVVLTEANMRVGAEELQEAGKLVSLADKRAIKAAIKNVQTFARAGIPQDWKFSPREGVVLGEKFTPMDRVGVYIPGGTAPLCSTVIHTAAIAKSAGVKEIVAVTPASREGKIHPAVLYAMKLAGVTEIYKLGGVYGIAAMAYGTESIRKVEKIVGPGNAYVTAAKKLVYGQVAIDMVAGPSEIMVIADESADKSFVAADMLSQAEHGSGLEQAVLVTTCGKLYEEIEAEILRQRNLLKRQATIDKVLANGTFIIKVDNLSQAAEIASKYAPEHIELQVKRPRALAPKIKSAGAIFLGSWTPEPIGDFCAGPSHVLPTAGSGKYFGGLSVEGFFRRSSLVEYTKSAIAEEAQYAHRFAMMEGLDGHGRSATIRVKNFKD
ncbi:MAG: histidinol dehydrogenase [Lentisphaeria bacterium]|nr:histidinol dehydrogenase [Lentisphaeria bacterium]